MLVDIIFGQVLNYKIIINTKALFLHTLKAFWIILHLKQFAICRFKAYNLCSIHSLWFEKYVFLAEIWFVKISTRTMKYESQVLQSNSAKKGKYLHKISMLIFIRIFFPGLPNLGAQIRCAQNRYTTVQMDLKYSLTFTHPEIIYLNSLNFRAPYFFAPSNFCSPNFRAPLKYGLSRTLLFSRNIYFTKFFNTVFNEKS